MYFFCPVFHLVKNLPRGINRAKNWVAAPIVAVALFCGVAAPAQSVVPAAVVKGPAEQAAMLLPSPPSGPAKFFPLAEVRRGLHGVAYTVFEGVKPEPMNVEILGVLTDAIGPGQDMILARLGGAKAAYTGVVAGMSGSPVYIDGRLVGAISYRIGQFSKDPIAGITPIQQMLEVRDRAAETEMRVAQSSGPGAPGANAAQGSSTSSSMGAPPATPMAAGGEVQPIATPLVFGGFSQDAVARFGDRFRQMGMMPVAGLGGAAAAGTKQPEPLVPGSAVSAILVRGDLSISGTCTVTYVDPKRLLACGHPITQFGSISMPMTKAEVLTTLASPMDSFKIINTTETVGAFTEDRASAIMGRFDERARMIPVSVDVVPAIAGDGAGAPAMRRVAEQIGTGDSGAITKLPTPDSGVPATRHGNMHFEVLDNRQLTPSAMLVSVYQSLSGTNESAGEMSYRMVGELTLKGLPPVRLDGIMAPTESGSGAETAAQYIGERFTRLYSNALEQPEVTGLRLKMEEIPERRTAVLEGARLAAPEAHPGDLIDVEATLHPYGEEARVVRTRVRLPETLTAGPLRIVVSDGATLDKLASPAETGGAHPMALADTVAQLNQSHENDRVYVTLLDHDPQAQLDSQALPGIPLSMANVLEPLKTAQKVQLTGESMVEAGSIATDYAVSGSQVLTLDVR